MFIQTFLYVQVIFFRKVVLEVEGIKESKKHGINVRAESNCEYFSKYSLVTEKKSISEKQGNRMEISCFIFIFIFYKASEKVVLPNKHITGIKSAIQEKNIDKMYLKMLT